MIEKYNRFLAKRRLIHRYKYLIEVDRILEEYITERILEGGSADFLAKSRKDLIDKQGAIKEQEKMVAFLKRVK